MGALFLLFILSRTTVSVIFLEDTYQGLVHEGYLTLVGL